MPPKADDIRTDRTETVRVDVSPEGKALPETGAGGGARRAWPASARKGADGAAAEPLDAVLNVRLTAREKAAFCEMASQAGLTASALARRRCMARPAPLHVEDVVIDRLRRAGLIALREKAAADEAGGRTMDAILRELRAALHLLNRPLDGRTDAKRP
jgi:hypothetical protein